MEELLKQLIKINTQIEKNTAPKSAFQFIVNDDKTDFTVTFNPPLELDNNKNYEIALLDLETYYSFPNIDVDNNTILYFTNINSHANNKGKEIIIPTGAHELDSLNAEIQKQLAANGDPEAIKFTFNPNTLLTTMEVKSGCIASFDHPHSLGNLLGFTKAIYKEGIYESEKLISILSVNSIFIHIDLITGSLVNGIPKQVIYSFFPKISPGVKLIETPYNLAYLPMTKKTINDLNIKITDQNNKLLNLRGETITIRFHIREM
jgi:hypothetical protein